MAVMPAAAAVRPPVTGLAPKLAPEPAASAVAVPLPAVIVPVTTLPAGLTPAAAPSSVPVTASSRALGSLAVETCTWRVSVAVLVRPSASCMR